MTPTDALKWVKDHHATARRVDDTVILPDLPRGTTVPSDLIEALKEYDGDLEAITAINGARIADRGETEAADASPAVFATYGPDELKNMPPIQFRVENLIPEGALVEIVGKSGDMKTFATLDIAFSVASDRTWHGRGVKGGGVLYVAAEGKAGMGQRVTAWETARHATLDPSYFRLITDAPQLLDDAQVDAVIATARQWHSDLIVLDTLARTMGGDENSTKDMNAYVAACNRIQRETGGTVAVVHHMGWNGERQRGSSALYAAMDAEITVTRDGDTVTLKVTKGKDFQDGEEIPFKSRVVELENGGTSVVLDRAEGGMPALTGIGKRIATILWDTFGESGATQSEWKAVCTDLKIAERSFYFGRTALVNGGYITDPAGKVRGHRYAVTEKFAPYITPKGAIDAASLSEGATAPIRSHPK